MDRRGVAGTLFATLLSGGAASVIGATALQTGSPYIDILIYGGIAAIAIGLIGLLCLLIFPSKKQPHLPPAIDQRVTSHRQSGGITAFEVKSTDDKREG